MEKAFTGNWGFKWSRGGLSSWFKFSTSEIRIEPEDNTPIFKDVNPLEIRKKINTREEQIADLNKTALKSGRGRSEGVGEDLLFVNGGKKAGPHKRITSGQHSQMDRNLFGGTEISKTMGWYGPRKSSAEVEDVQKAKNLLNNQKDKTYGDKLQNAAKFVERKDLSSLDDFGKGRSKKLEEEVFGLYKGRPGGESKFGTTSAGLIDLEFFLTNFSNFLKAEEKDLIEKEGSYGKIVNNKKIRWSRTLGDVEKVFGNYVRKTLGGDREKISKLDEKNIGLVVKGLLNGEKLGYDCENPDKEMSQHFPECTAFKGDGKIKAVIKSTYNVRGEYGIPQAGREDFGHLQDHIKGRNKKYIDMDKVTSSPLLDEQCEESSLGSIFSSLELRRNICQQILLPGFGENVEDKRLCLIEVSDFQYHLRLSTYLNVMELPSGHDKNTFGTKCSNYNI